MGGIAIASTVRYKVTKPDSWVLHAAARDSALDALQSTLQNDSLNIFHSGSKILVLNIYLAAGNSWVQFIYWCKEFFHIVHITEI